MRILVTGREGQVARSLAERASAHPALELVATSRAEADLSSSGSVAAVIAALRPDLVINAAAYTAVDQAEDEPALAFRINAEGAGEAAAAARQVGAAFVQLSTDYVFDGEAAEPYRPDAPTDPLSVYGRSKLAGEEAVRVANPAHLILRTAWVYSLFGRNFLKSMVAAARTQDTLTVVDDQLGSPTSALDLADGILSIALAWQTEPAQGRGNVYHLAGPEQLSWCAFAGVIMEECRRLGLPAADVQPISTAEWPTAAMRPRNSALDSGKFARDFGFTMPPLSTSLGPAVQRLAAQA